MDISVIVPVYNTGKYIGRCLDSIFSQNFEGTFEVVAVDDASTDNSLVILNEYQKGEKRLKVIAQTENKKQTITRATGVRKSKGDFILYVDSDDWLLPGALSNLFCIINQSGADIVAFNYIKQNSAGKRLPARKILKSMVTADKLKAKDYFLGTAVNKFVKRWLIVDMATAGTTANTGEDLVFCLEMLLKAKKICLVPEYYYVYYSNIHSITHITERPIRLKNIENVLINLKLLFAEYPSEKQLQSYCLKNVEKSAFMHVTNLAFMDGVKKADIKSLVDAFGLFPAIKNNRIHEYFKILKYKYISVIQVRDPMELKSVLGIIIRYIFKKLFRPVHAV